MGARLHCLRTAFLAGELDTSETLVTSETLKTNNVFKNNGIIFIGIARTLTDSLTPSLTLRTFICPTEGIYLPHWGHKFKDIYLSHSGHLLPDWGHIFFPLRTFICPSMDIYLPHWPLWMFICLTVDIYLSHDGRLFASLWIFICPTGTVDIYLPTEVIICPTVYIYLPHSGANSGALTMDVCHLFVPLREFICPTVDIYWQVLSRDGSTGGVRGDCNPPKTFQNLTKIGWFQAFWQNFVKNRLIFEHFWTLTHPKFF